MKMPHFNLSVRFAAIAFCGFYFVLAQAQAETLTGRVVAVADGDTITVIDTLNQQHKIRLTGIDAPEKKQAFGQVSKQHLADHVFGKQVSVEWFKHDKYQRILGKVLVGGQDANLEQVKAGLAWHYVKYAAEQPPADRRLYSEAEGKARLNRVGLWRDSSPVPPWDFRHSTGTAAPDGRAQAGMPCPCSSESRCTGPRGGHYCTTNTGKKRYH
jgi:endonuclease YncB( thermonuclease family)